MLNTINDQHTNDLYFVILLYYFHLEKMATEKYMTDMIHCIYFYIMNSASQLALFQVADLTLNINSNTEVKHKSRRLQNEILKRILVYYCYMSVELDKFARINWVKYF